MVSGRALYSIVMERINQFTTKQEMNTLVDITVDLIYNLNYQ